MNISKTQEEIRNLTIKAQRSKSVSDRAEIQEQISGYLLYLQGEEAKAFRGKEEAYLDRKEAEAKYIYDSKESVTKAKESAPYKCRDYRRKEASKLGDWENLRTFRQVASNHLELMRQTTANLRKEDELTRIQT